MNALTKKISEMNDKQLAEVRAQFDAFVDIPKKHPLEFSVLVALNGECQRRGIKF